MRIALTVAAVLGLLVPPSSSWSDPGQAPSGALAADDLIARCARAMGGRARIDSIKTLRIWAVYPDHGDRPLGTEIKRPNMTYNPQGQLAFDGRRACFLNGSKHDGKPEMVDPSELADFDLEIAHLFPAFFDYPARHAGAGVVDGRPTHRLDVRLPLGATVTYHIDPATWLPVRIDGRLTMRGQAIEVQRVLSDYRTIEGLQYPHGFTYAGRDKQTLHARITAVEINPLLPDAHFQVPAGIKAPRVP